MPVNLADAAERRGAMIPIVKPTLVCIVCGKLTAERCAVCDQPIHYVGRSRSCNAKHAPVHSHESGGAR